ncbi:hypothetical protein FJZ26_06060 [Candidatus Parvarchaeota archaeon]|nr:hypothetical protein [Candidatus Parvarchaeota archaeon]
MEKVFYCAEKEKNLGAVMKNSACTRMNLAILVIAIFSLALAFGCTGQAQGEATKAQDGGKRPVAVLYVNQMSAKLSDKYYEKPAAVHGEPVLTERQVMKLRLEEHMEQARQAVEIATLAGQLGIHEYAASDLD